MCDVQLNMNSIQLHTVRCTAATELTHAPFVQLQLLANKLHQGLLIVVGELLRVGQRTLAT